MQYKQFLSKSKYDKWYISIIDSAINENRTKGKTYYESHHILPSCLHPEYSCQKSNPWNIVLLTAREHLICHKLLNKMFPNNTKLYYATWMMINMESDNQDRYKVCSREYDRIKRIIRNIAKRKWEDPEKNPNRSKWMKGSGNPMFDSQRFGELNPFYNKNHSTESKNKISKSIKSHYKINKSSSFKTIWVNNGIINRRVDPNNIPIGFIKGSIKRKCPYCKSLVGLGNAKRYHFDNCISKN